MRGRGLLPLLVVLLGLVTIGGILFVYLELSREGRPFGGATASGGPGAQPPALPTRPKPAPPPERLPEPASIPVEPPPPPPPETPTPDPVTPGPEAPAPTAEELAADAELTLEAVPAEGDPLTPVDVVVSDSEGYAIEHALVVFRSGDALLYRERSDETGRARFVPIDGDLPPYRVDAIAPGYVVEHAPAVQPGTEVTLVLRPRPVIEGEVRSRSETNSAATVTLYLGDRVYTQRPGEDGRFRFEDLDPGPATVFAELPAYGADSEEFYLEPGTVRHVRLAVRPEKRVLIRGDIAFWPDKGDVWINGIRVAVNGSGTFEFDRAVHGSNEILIDAPPKAPLRERFDVGGRSTGGYRFSLRNGEEIKGRVRSAKTGRPVADALVRIGVDLEDPANSRVPFFPVERILVAKSDADGRFVVERLDNRLTYLVSIVAPGYGQFLGSTNPGRGLFNAILPEGPFVFGKLSGLGGVPRDAVVTALRIADHSDARRFNVPSWDGARGTRDEKGLYGLSGLMPGTYLIQVHAPGYGALETMIDLGDQRRTRLDLRLRRGADVEQAEAELLRRLPPVVDTEAEDLPADATILFVDLTRPPGEIQPPGVRVRFFMQDMEFLAPLELDILVFPLRGLPEGEYRAILTHPTFAKPLVRERVRLSRTAPAELAWR